MRVLLLGGTTEGNALAAALAAAGIAAVHSFAGRTASPAPQPVPLRQGGFGGPEGLARALTEGRFTHLVDATHPFAARIKPNAVAAAALAGVPLIALDRPAWTAGPGDRWTEVPSLAAAAATLPAEPVSVFLAIGRQELAAFAAAPQHRYLLRLVDPPAAPPPLPQTTITLARGPFTLEGDLALMRRHAVQTVVAKNSGGEGARAKLDAARALGLPVVMVARPPPPDRPAVATPAAVIAWLHDTLRGV
jgi:precorrin-6A/cobalt-precorrin-6A reductase